MRHVGLAAALLLSTVIWGCTTDDAVKQQEPPTGAVTTPIDNRTEVQDAGPPREHPVCKSDVECDGGICLWADNEAAGRPARCFASEQEACSTLDCPAPRVCIMGGYGVWCPKEPMVTE